MDKLLKNRLDQIQPCQSSNHEKMHEALQKLSCLKKYEDQTSIINKLEIERNQLKSQLEQTRHESLLAESKLKSSYEGDSKVMKTKNEECEKHIKVLSTEIKWIKNQPQ